MTSNTKIAFELLMQNEKNFVLMRPTPKGTERYCIYDNEIRPLYIVPTSSFQELRNVLTKKRNKYYISKQAIRQQHGNSYFKKSYLKTKHK